VADTNATLGRQHEPVALAGKPLADDLLGTARGLRCRRHRVGIGGVEKDDAALGGPVEDGKRGRLIALVPEGHRAEADF
jgi:hypothetical protein